MNDTVRKALELQIQAFLGLPYIWGGEHPCKGFDCSGVVLELLKSVGLVDPKVDMSANDLSKTFPSGSSPDIAQFGEIAFFGSPGKITHVGFCLGSGLMFEAGGGDKDCRTRVDAILHGAFLRIRPIKRRKDLVLICKPTYPA